MTQSPIAKEFRCWFIENDLNLLISILMLELMGNSKLNFSESANFPFILETLSFIVDCMTYESIR